MSQSNCHIVSMGHIDLTKDKPTIPADTDCLPIIPTRNLVLFPGVTTPMMLVRDYARLIAGEVSALNTQVGICCQRNDSEEEAKTIFDVDEYGVIANVLQVFDLPDGSQTALLAAGEKFKIVCASGAEPLVPHSTINAIVKVIHERVPKVLDRQMEVLFTTIRDLYAELMRKSDNEMGGMMADDDNFHAGAPLPPVDKMVLMINSIATNLNCPTQMKKEMLRCYHFRDRMMLLHHVLTECMERVDIATEIRDKAHEGLNEQSRNAFLHQQLEAIRSELYGEDGTEETNDLLKRADAIAMPEAVRKTFNKEVEKLKRINPSNPDYSTSYSYLETLLDLPWGQYKEQNTDFAQAEATLDGDHYGLEKVKDRILEQMAVMMNHPQGRSPILCLVGAPGVGKTSLGQSVAKALGRDYQRVSLGGLHDEAEIRGHRRTYIGAMPGRIIEALRRCKSQNPVLLLDEVDKVGHDYKGDPSAALLEVLDPEQNCHFHDNYVDVDFDLSKVLFIATANTLEPLSQPLLDRMEIIEIAGYVPQEKIEIARRHLLPRVLADHNVKPEELAFSDDALRAIIDRYTRESGVRQLEKALASVVRKVVLKKMRQQPYPALIEPQHLKEYLGIERNFHDDCRSAEGFAGVATGLAWTAVGGEILFIEASLSQSKASKLTLTGNLGDVMKESASIALQYVRAHAAEFGIDPAQFETTELHIHVPEGAIPKDGPSAGITMAAAIVSAFTAKPLLPGYAMTGEITLRGRVLPVGGIKEKILAAKRAGATDIILSTDNRRDIDDIPACYLQGLTFHYVDTAAQALRQCVMRNA